MKYTQYFLHVRKRPDRAIIKNEWIKDTIDNPFHTEVQSDGRIRKWKKIPKRANFCELFCFLTEKQFTMLFSTEALKGN